MVTTPSSVPRLLEPLGLSSLLVYSISLFRWSGSLGMVREQLSFPSALSVGLAASYAPPFQALTFPEAVVV